MNRVAAWTESRYWSFIRSMLRKGFSRYPNKYKALANSKGGRNQYKCAGCNEIYGKKEVAVDHITPCGKLQSYEDVGVFVNNMFCSEDALQVLCTNCHYRKTMTERGLTEEDIAALWFKKLPAKEQRAYLLTNDVVPAKNAEQRIKQYMRTL